jgi:hypothetical protein
MTITDAKDKNTVGTIVAKIKPVRPRIDSAEKVALLY